MRLTSAALAAATLILVSQYAPAQAEAWDLIGVRTVSHGVDRDVIRVRGHQRYRAIRICVSRWPINLRDADVVFANGGSQRLAVRRLFVPGSCSRAIDLRGRGRDIQRVVLRYNRLLPGRAPVVRVYAR